MLTAAQSTTLDGLLAREADMAYRRRARWLLDALAPAPEDRVLDVGCGHGWYLHALARTFGVAPTGLDGDPERVAAARALVPSATVVTGDAHRLPFADGAFDAVLLTETLEHFTDDAQAVREALRVLRPGGVLAISVPHADYPPLWDPVNFAWIRMGGAPIRSGPLAGIWWGHERLYRPADVDAVLTGAGFAVERLEEATHHCVPFSHLLVYGLGKTLLERGLLPRRLRARADRFDPGDAPPPGLDPISLGRAVLRAADRRNDRPHRRRPRTWVNVLALARKPG